MSPTGRIVIPVLFVVLLIVVLGRPILISGLDLDTEQTEPAPTVQGDNKKSEKSRGLSRLAASYPKECLAGAPDPGLGLIAASDGATVTAGSPTGADAFALQARPPIGFSASGRFLATAGADLWTSQGKHVGVAFGDPVMKWTWSPVADCIAGVDGGRLLVTEPNSKAVVLINDMEVGAFSFSPDGARLLFAVEGASRSSGLWLADLRSGKVRILQSSLGWNLIGWSRTMQPILLRDGAIGRAADAALGFLPSDMVADCGGEIIAISRGRLAVVGVSGPPSYVSADRRYRYHSVACAPDGDALVVVRSLKNERATSMAVIDRDGAVVEEVAQQSSVEDAPLWGPPRTGVVFVGDPGGEGAVGPLVWFLPEGGTARPTGLRVDKFGDGLDGKLDWSATPPLGYPTS